MTERAVSGVEGEAEKRERRDLAQAEQHIADGERHLAEQVERIARMMAAGAGTALAENLLGTMKNAQRQHEEHRRLILERIAQLEAERG